MPSLGPGQAPTPQDSVLSPPEQGALPSKATSPFAYPGPTPHSLSPDWSQPAKKAQHPPNSLWGGKGAQEASACPWLHCSPSPKLDPEQWPLTVGSVWTETISSGFTSCWSSEGVARPGSFCLEGKECTRQSPPQPVWGSAGSQKGPEEARLRGPDPLAATLCPSALRSVRRLL